MLWTRGITYTTATFLAVGCQPAPPGPAESRNDPWGLFLADRDFGSRGSSRSHLPPYQPLTTASGTHPTDPGVFPLPHGRLERPESYLVGIGPDFGA